MTKKIVLWFALFLTACASLDSTTAAVTSEEASEKPLPRSCCCVELVKMADTTITGTKVYPANLQVPTPGDDVKAAVAPGAVRPAYQKLINGMSGAQAQLYGRISRYRVVMTDNNNMSVGRLGAFAVKNGSGDWQVYTDVDNTAAYGSPNTYTLFDPEALYGAPLTTGRYYVYATYPAAAANYDLVVLDSTAGNEPDQGYFYRKNDETKIFLTTFYVDNVNLAIPYMQTGGRFVYKTRTSIGFGITAGNLVLRAGHAVASTGVNFGASVPITPTLVRVAFQIARAGVAFRGAASGEAASLVAGSPNGVDLWGDGTTAVATAAEFETIGDGTQFFYILDNAGVDAYAWIAGFQLW